MYIRINEDGYITDYSQMLGLDGASEYNGKMPDDILENIGFYKFDGKTFTLDVEKKAASIKAVENAEKIEALHTQLASTDYVAAKLAESTAAAQATGDNTALSAMLTKYAAIIADRQSWREEIDTLESEGI